MSRDWDESEHPRHPRHTSVGGEPVGGRFREQTGGGWAEQVADRLPALTTNHLSRFELSRSVREPTEPVGPLNGGNVANTQLHRTADGRLVVRKQFAPIEADKAQIEVLVGLVAEAVGAPYPPVVEDPRLSDEAIYMGYVDAAPVRGGILRDTAEYFAMHRTDDGFRLGLLDILTANGDRHSNNVIKTADGRLWGIDGSEAFQHTHASTDGDGAAKKPPYMRVPGFSVRFARTGLSGQVWKDNDLSPEDVAAVRPRLEALKPFFDQARMDLVYVQMMQRFEAVAKRAKGTRRMLTV